MAKNTPVAAPAAPTVPEENPPHGGSWVRNGDGTLTRADAAPAADAQSADQPVTEAH